MFQLVIPPSRYFGRRWRRISLAITC